MAQVSEHKPMTKASRIGGAFSMSMRVSFVALAIIAGATLWLSNSILTSRFTASTKSKAEYRLALYAGNLLSELQRSSIVPQLLSRDPELIGALNSADYSMSTQLLISFVDEIGAASLMLLDIEGSTVASTDRINLGALHSDKSHFQDALKSSGTIFNISKDEGGGNHFIYSRRIEAQNDVLGVILVEVDLHKFERAWAGVTDAVLVTDSSGDIVLSTEPKWRGLTEEVALLRQPPEGAIERAMRITEGWTTFVPVDAYVQGEAVMRVEGRIAFRGWQITSFTAYSSVRDRVNGYLAIEVMIFASLFVLLFYAMNRRTALRMLFVQRESNQLRALNSRLQREIAARERVQRNLEVAEQSLAQSSKLAALGEMSAAVSHELNQPLAAMKTYMAGAVLLLKRKRPEEALSAFHRIDDLIERMGAITKQLKSYARKGGEGYKVFDMRDAVASSLAMMEPQLRQSNVSIQKVLTDAEVLVTGDRMRIEQVLVNLLRNALDATKTITNPEIEIMLSKGDHALVQVRDNGHGIEDLENLFEPFHTTKPAGEGVGLGLAISSGFVKEMGGRLTAHNEEAGAVFEIQLPIFKEAGQISKQLGMGVG